MASDTFELRGSVLNALSINSSDPDLNNEGLTNQGLLGFILTEQLKDTEGLISLTLFNSKDYLYTTSIPKEKVEKRNPINNGILGYVFTKPLDGTIRLHRFFNKRTWEHLYVTNPFNVPSYYQDESNANPIYLLKSKTHNSVPIYFYSNSNNLYFEPISFNNDSITKQERIQDLWNMIDNQRLQRTKFQIPLTSDDSITVFLNNSFHNFYINLQANKEFYTVRRNPFPESESSILEAVDSWKEVQEYFKIWLEAINNTKPNRPDFSKAEGVLLVESATQFEFRNDKIKPALNINAQVEIFLKVLNAIKMNETGLLIGIFGRWGRGKTYFWKILTQKIISENISDYDYLEFHAWKYQDTPASWGYLYELFASKFYKVKRKFLWIPISFWNRIWLNIQRLGPYKFWSLILTIAFWFVWYFILDFLFKIDLFLTIIFAFGFGTIISGLLFYFKFSGLARELFKFYFTKVSFSDLLGKQAEIQKELVILLKTWIPEKKVGSKRLILFVDDIDRCDEVRIIQVIDSLKIMIDDPEIAKRVIVLAAIDEVTLKRAIKLKYSSMVQSDLNLDQYEKKRELDQLCREYMDKLFINGFKLGTLTSKERVEIFRNLSEEQTFFRNNDKERNEYNGGGQFVEEIDSGLGLDITSKLRDQVPTLAKTKKIDHEDYISVVPKEMFELMDYEVSGLSKAIMKYTDATPRSIRIFYYRYLLAKEFKDRIITKGSRIYLEWHSNQERKAILPYLIVTYSQEKQHKDLIAEIRLNSVRNDSQLEVNVLGEEFTLSKELYFMLLKVVETVVPY